MWQSARATSRAWTLVCDKLAATDDLLSTAELDALLAKVASLPLPPPRLRTDDVGGTLAALATKVPTKSELLVADFMLVLRHCCKEKLPLRAEHVTIVLTYCMNALLHCPSWYAEPTLTGMALLLRDNADKCPLLHASIVTHLAAYLDPTSADVGARFAATQCVAYLLHASSLASPPAYALRLWTTLVDNFLQQCRQLRGDVPGVQWTMDRILYKTCAASLECILALLPAKDAPDLGQQMRFALSNVLASLRQILGCGLVLQGATSSSISDSDSETLKQGIGLSARLRHLVVRVLCTILKVYPTSITLSMSLYLPETFSAHMVLYDQSPSILTLLLSDPYELVRLEALKWLELLWPALELRCDLTLAKAPTATTFRSRSATMLLMVHQVHIALLHAMRVEPDMAALVQILKTLTLLVQQVPYGHVLQELAAATPPLASVLHAMLGHVHALLFASDHSIRVAALACMSSLLSTNEPCDVVLRWLEGEALTLTLPTKRTPWMAARKTPFLVEMLVQAKANEPLAVPFHRLDAMALLSKVAKNYAPGLSRHWSRLADFLLVAFRDVDQNVRLQAVKILENYIKGDAANNHYLPFLSTHVVRAFHDPSHHVRASVCACFTLLREADWATLSLAPLTKTFLATPLDASAVVRAAGFRLLGALVLLPIFKTPSFVSQVVQLGMRLATDSTLNVRVRVVWAIGNACTTPGPDSTDAQDMYVLRVRLGVGFLMFWLVSRPWLIMLLEPALVCHVLECMLTMLDDNDKVVSSVVRTMGLVARWLCASPYLSQVAQLDVAVAPSCLLATAMESLARKIGDGAPKVRWNSCHALAKIFQSPELPVASAPWTPTVFAALLGAIQQQDNFKVRISATMALRVSLSRVSYGVFYEPIVVAVVDTLDAVVELKDICEFKYKEQLELQLSFTLLHLVGVAQSPADEALLGTIFSRQYKNFVYDWLYHHQNKMYAAIFGDEGEDCCGPSDDGHEVNPLSCSAVVHACDVLYRVVRDHCPAHVGVPSGKSPKSSSIFEMDLNHLDGFEF
ncbi:hypothetical protein SPRG_05553 [Saprolegnia parasitica CBS 223.65]|uniref:DUF4042 domain-containing protein n=1 Tax=Saprolegnia parasitica (strain CBS 223.65) TaxID=695850 RepID=A0A067CK76_SAPPC|nr:hypothetical protein SPRG_05553 [Saprolegnia parasitica CBS 223.65]KDO29600.1 hypothetical protein SPRG_05553 [Saprolegnia parasitica CBS 223.65]|eukprot:XP_012199660.1 hypothetical protein SPRG_05553 [Saprolegnia parasitica CBS 223.65]